VFAGWEYGWSPSILLFFSGVGQRVRSAPRYAEESAAVSDSGAEPVSGVRTIDTPRRRPGVVIMKLLSVLAVVPVLRWLVEVHSVPAGQPWRTDVPLRPPHPGRLELTFLLLVGVGLIVQLPVAYFWWAALAAPMVFVDLAVHRLPDRLTYCAAIGVWALLLLSPDPRAFVAGAVVALAFALSTLILGRRGFGLGDAKLALSCAALLGSAGWSVVAAGLMAAFVASAVVSLGLLAARRVRWSSHLPFGPFLVLGTVVGLVLAGVG
jgi:leader peptidase (prepilin peptidase)/N-methyltransferase